MVLEMIIGIGVGISGGILIGGALAISNKRFNVWLKKEKKVMLSENY